MPTMQIIYLIALPSICLVLAAKRKVGVNSLNG